MLDDLKILFSTYTEAVICESGGIIKYMNAPAVLLAGRDYTGENTSRLLPAAVLESDAEVYSFTAELNGSVCVSACALSGFRVFTIVRPYEDKAHYNLCMNVANNLKHSLSVYQMASALMRPYVENVGDDQLTSFFSMMSHSSYSVLRTAENIMFYGALENDEPAGFEDVFDILPLCRNISESVSLLTEKHLASLRFEASIQQAAVRGNRQQIETAILNLLSNSLKYTPSKGIVTISVSVSGQNVAISVTDTGEGIPEHMMRSVFEHYMDSHDLIDIKRGIGFGLAIVRHIARRHCGNLVITSRPGTGTKATLILPKAELPGENHAVSVSPEAAGLNSIITALSDVLPHDSYAPKYMD